MLIRFGTAEERDCHLCPWVAVNSGTEEVRGKIYGCSLSQRQREPGVEDECVGLMKRIVDNPHDEHLCSERAAGHEGTLCFN